MARDVWGDEVEVESAGVAAWEGNPSTHEAMEVARERSLDLSQHRARHVSGLDLDRYDHVVALTEGIAERLRSDFGVAEDRLLVLEVEDPFGFGIESYRRVAGVLDGAIDELRTRVLGEK